MAGLTIPNKPAAQPAIACTDLLSIMICSICGGHNVIWRGPMINLTHTECSDCGGTNCQEVEHEEPCEGCGDGDKVPAKGYFRCPVCDAEWPDEDEDSSDNAQLWHRRATRNEERSG